MSGKPFGLRIKERIATEKKLWLRSFRWYHQLYLLLIPVLLNFIVFDYVPMAGVQIAFKDFVLKKGIWDSEWIGFRHFLRFFNSYNFGLVLKNTLYLSLLSLAFSFPLSICLALILNEISHRRLNQVLQTIFIIPHFVSTVVVVGIMMAFCSPTTGIINLLLMKFHIIDQGIYFSRLSEYFRPMYVISGLWQQTGWGAVIYLSALSAIDPGIYEAAEIDGASRWKQLTNITIPCIWPTIVIQLILNCGRIMSLGYQKVFLMQTTTNLDVSEIISTFVYTKGITNQQYDYATAIGLFNSVINLITLLIVNRIAKKRSEVSLW